MNKPLFPMPAVSRRGFIIGSSAAAVGVAFADSFAGASAALAAEDAAAAAVAKPNQWIIIARDGTITLYSAAAEMGQGVRTSQPLSLAEELDADWAHVRAEQSPANDKLYGNPLFGGMQFTGGSLTTQGTYMLLRKAGAQARRILMMNAAEHWGVPLSEVTTEPSAVVHAGSGKRLSYGEIAAFAKVPDKLPEISDADLKKPADFRLIGHDVGRADIPDKVRGAALYGIDAKMPGMLYGVVLRSPVLNGTIDHLDDSAAKAVDGVVAVVPIGYGVGVVGKSLYAARKGRDALKVAWKGGAKDYDSAKVADDYAAISRDVAKPGVSMTSVGDIPGALAKAPKTKSQVYVNDHAHHATMEPMNGTASVAPDGKSAELWMPTQAPTLCGFVASAVLKIPPTAIKVTCSYSGGGFGRRFEMQWVTDAVLLSNAVKKPVKVVWTREDDIQQGIYRPLVAQNVTMGYDADGNMLAYRHRIVGDSIIARSQPAGFAKSQGRDPVMTDGADPPYKTPAHSVDYIREDRGVSIGFWRAVAPGYTKFAMESMIDEVALELGKDPIDYRLMLFGDNARFANVLKTAAEMADWKKPRPAGRALGVAFSDSWHSPIAQICEISLDRKTGKIRVHDVWCAVDPGTALQPKNVEAQVMSAITYGMGAALQEHITIKGGVVQESNFNDYTPIRMADAPWVHVKVLASGGAPGGMGEIGLPPIAPAIANAVARLTGVRLRHLPMTPDRVAAAMGA